eukprot:6654698-Alexandrium_andersonii.AAC.1
MVVDISADEEQDELLGVGGSARAPWDTPSQRGMGGGVSPTQPFVSTPVVGASSGGSFSQDTRRPMLDVASPRSPRSGAVSPHRP